MSLKTVLCTKDTVLNQLCTECEKKLSSNKITELDITVSHKLGKLSKIFPLTNVEFKKAIDLEELVVLSCTGNIGSLIGTNGKIVSEITKHLGKKVRVIEHTKNEKKMVSDLIGNARVIGLKKIFSPGSLEYKVIVSKNDQNKLVTTTTNIENALKTLLNAQITIEFE